MKTDQKLLRSILQLPGHVAVKVLYPGKWGLYQKISAVEALALLDRGRFEWCGNHRRIRKMRPIGMLKPEPVWIECYRTSGAPALQPSVEWITSRCSR